MAETYNKFLDFVDQLGRLEHNLNGGLHKVALSNTLPVNTNTILSNITQITNGNGYTTLGEAAGNTWAESAGTGTLTATAITWTASGAGMATFQYCVYYSNATAVTLVNPLICWWTRAAGTLALAAGETFTLKFNSLTGAQPVFTLA